MNVRDSLEWGVFFRITTGHVTNMLASRGLSAVRPLSIVFILIVALAAVIVHPLTAAAATTGAQFVSGSGTLVDTRYGPGTQTPLAANSWRSVQISGVAGVPTSSVTAVAVMAVVAGSPSAGTFTVRPTGGSAEMPVMYYAAHADSNTSNSAIVTLGTGGKLDIKATTNTDVVLFLEGYYTTASGTTAGGFVPTAPTIVAQSTSALQPGSTTKFQITGDAVPSTAKAVFLNISTKHENSAGGDWSIYSADGAANVTSFNVPNTANAMTSNGVVVALGASGALNLKLRGAAMDVTIRVEGYYGAGSSAGSFTPGNGVLLNQTTAVNGNLTLPVSGHAGIPQTTAGLTSVVLHIDSAPKSGDSSISSYTGKASYVNAKADGSTTWDRALDTTIGTARSNTVTVAVGLDGAIALQSSNYGHALLKVSVEGWYTGPSTTLCKHDDVSITNLSSAGQADGQPTVAATMSNALGQDVNTSLYLQDAAGKPVGGTPAASGTITSGTRAVFHPTGLTVGATYTWWVYGSVADTCAAQATSAKQTITIGAPTATTPTATGSLLINGADLGAQSGPLGGSFQAGNLAAGSDGTATWISTLKPSLASVPAGARITKATLHTGTPSCLSGAASCSDTALTIAAAKSALDTSGTPSDVAALPLYDDGTAIPASGGDIDLTTLVQSWYNAGDTSNNGAVVTARSGSDGLTITNPSLEIAFAAPTAPSAPLAVHATAGDGGVLVTWLDPADTGYVDQTGQTNGITSYTVAAVGTDKTVTVNGTSAVITGLSNGTKYQLAVTANNPVGSSQATTNTATPVAAPGGSSAYINAVTALATAQSDLESGDSDSTDDAANGNTAVLGGLAVNASDLITDADAAATSDRPVTDETTDVSNTIVVYNSAAATATVFATVTDHGTVQDDSDPDNPVSIPQQTTEDVAYTMTTTAAPTFLATADAAAAVAPVSPNDDDTLTAANGTSTPDPGAGVTEFTMSAQTGAITAPTTTTQATQQRATLTRTAAVRVNYSGLVNWANSNASSKNNNGYNSDDCTDFSSRAMYYGGGMHMKGPQGIVHIDSNDNNWYHYVGGTSYSKSWGDVSDNAKFEMNQGAKFMQRQSDIAAGDLLYVDWAGGTGFDHLNHMGVVTKVTSKNIYIAQHTRNGTDTLNGGGAHSWKHAHPYLSFYVARPVEK